MKGLDILISAAKLKVIIKAVDHFSLLFKNTFTKWMLYCRNLNAIRKNKKDNARTFRLSQSIVF
ncbi:hypothetical protein [Mycoplasma sp. Z631]|uniref:hypothetical protein n=1 Tax=Mycoplasma sp. Z631 TaxID=3401685 RepID=UPI003AB01E1A